jgi:hypothetical protein
MIKLEMLASSTRKIQELAYEGCSLDPCSACQRKADEIEEVVLVERARAFNAGQEEMRERAAGFCENVAKECDEVPQTPCHYYDSEAIRALPLGEASELL